MRLFLIFLGFFIPQSALAHFGHLGDVVGHDHWLGAAALGIALGAALYGALKGKPKEEASDEETADAEDEELVEA